MKRPSISTAATFILTAEREGERLDLFLARSCPGLSRSQAQRLIAQGLATVDGRPERASFRLRPGQRVVAAVPPPQAVELAPEEIPLRVVYEDADVIVVDKPAGMAVHPAPGHPSGTLVNALLAYCPDLSDAVGAPGQAPLRPGIVHRLDKDTSGLLMVAKNDRAHRDLSRQLKERQVHKLYLALVEGRLEPPEGVIEAPIARHPRQRKRMAVVEGGRPATTRYRVRRYYDGQARGGQARGGQARGPAPTGYTLVEAEPVTGRTHQVRVHFAALGHPLVGDATYGKPSPLVSRQFLHAWRLGFKLPSTGEEIELEAELPEALTSALAALAGE